MFKPLDYKAHAFSKYQGRETAMWIFDMKKQQCV